MFRTYDDEVINVKHEMQSPVFDEKMAALERAVVLQYAGIKTGPLLRAAMSVADSSSHSRPRCTKWVMHLIEENYTEHRKDCNDFIFSCTKRGEPLVRSMAIREASKLIDAENMHDFIGIIKKGAKDADPYVRKTTALAIITLNEKDPNIVDENELDRIIEALMQDGNANVVANALQALKELNSKHEEPYDIVKQADIENMLSVLSQATEWSQIEILEYVAGFTPDNETSAIGVIRRLMPSFSSSNAGVVCAAMRACLAMNMYIDNKDVVNENIKKIIPSILALVNEDSSIQYVAIKSLIVMFQNYHLSMNIDISLFFCKYNDPVYIKEAKIEAILTLANDYNIRRIIIELFEYAQQGDTYFVIKSIQAIGAIALEFEAAAEQCITKVIELIKNQDQDTTQECIVVATDILRRYPGKYESLIPNICNSISSSLDDPKAKSALIWLLGHYCSIITNAADLVQSFFIDDFKDDNIEVQLCLLSTVIKLYINDKETCEDMYENTIKICKESNNPNLRDRASFYNGLIKKHPEIAARMIEKTKDASITYDKIKNTFKTDEQIVKIACTTAILIDKPPTSFLDWNEGLDEKSESSTSTKSKATSSDKLRLLSHADDNVSIYGKITRYGDNIYTYLRFENNTENNVKVTRITFDPNNFLLASQNIKLPDEMKSSESVTTKVAMIKAMNQHNQNVQTGKSLAINISFDTCKDERVEIDLPFTIILLDEDSGGKLKKQDFVDLDKSFTPDDEYSETITKPMTIQSIMKKFVANRLFYIAKMGSTYLFSGLTIAKDQFIVSVRIDDRSQINVTVKTRERNIAYTLLPLIKQQLFEI